MAEKLEIRGKVLIDTSDSEESLKLLSDKLKEAQKNLEKMNSQFGAGSDESKKAAKQIEELENKIKDLKNPEDVDEPIKSLNQQLTEAKKRVIDSVEEFGKFSPEAKQAAEDVKVLQKKLSDAKGLVDTLDPASKFAALRGAIQGAAGALTAITAAQGLFGKESDAVQKTLLKVQSAMALSEGIDSVIQAGGSFKKLGEQLMSLSVVQKVVTAGQWLWNAAMSANPIGAVVTVVAALIAGIVALTSWLIKSAEAAKQQAAQVKENGKEVERLGKQLEKTNTQFEKNQAQQLAMAKASGKSAEEIRKLELKLADEKIAFEQSARAIASNTRTKELNYLATLKQNGASDETIKAQQKVVENATKILNDQNDKLQKAYDAKTDIENRHQVEITQAATDGEKKRSDDAKKAAEDRAAANKAANENILKMTQEFEASKITNANDAAKKRLENELQNSIKAVEQTKASEKLKQEQIALLKQKYNADVQKIDDDDNKKRAEAQKKYDQDRLKVADDLAKQAVQIELNAIKDANQRRDKELQINRDNEIKAAQLKYAQGLLTLTEYLQQQALIRAKYKQEENANSEADAKKKFDDDVKELDDKIKNTDESFAIRKKAIDDEQKLIDKALKGTEAYNAANKKLTDERIKIALEELAKKKEIQDEIYGLFQKANELFQAVGEAESEKINQRQKNDVKVQKELLDSKKITQKQYEENIAKINDDADKKKLKIQKRQIIADKAVSIAGIIMNTLQGNAKALVKPGWPEALPIIAMNSIQGALAVATTIAQASKALSALGGGEGGGGGGDMGSGAPMAPQAQQTALPQEQINQLASANAATRAYVLESDVSGNQERITRINRAARIS